MTDKHKGGGDRLSNNVLSLRFMQQSKERELREALKKEQDEISEASKWVSRRFKPVALRPSSVVYLESHPTTDAHASGRQSFGKFNIAVEKLMHLQAALRKQVERRSEREATAATEAGAPEVEITDVEMARRLGSLSGKKRDRGRKGMYDGAKAGKKMKIEDGLRLRAKLPKAR